MYVSGKSLVIILTLFNALLLACKPNNDGTLNLEKPSFKTYDDTELFFKNVRQVYYDLENQENTKLKLYRLKKRIKNAKTHPVLNLTLVHNWRYDEAYLLLEPNAFFENPRQITLHWENPKDKTKGTLQLNAGSKEAMLVFAYQIYQKILLDCKLLVIQADKQTPFLEDKQEREAFRISVADYLRLIQSK